MRERLRLVSYCVRPNDLWTPIPPSDHPQGSRSKRGWPSRSGFKELEAVARRYAIGLTPALAALISRGDPADPIARQFVPDARELIRDPAERDDPIGDDAMSPVEGWCIAIPIGC